MEDKKLKNRIVELESLSDTLLGQVDSLSRTKLHLQAESDRQKARIANLESIIKEKEKREDQIGLEGMV